jgi:adenylyltransferase/sulfurtransferase
MQLHDKTRDRYRSIAESPVWEIAKVRKARVLVVGAGALGNEVAKNLAMMGVRQIVVVDRDTVETANLTRSVFFRETDHGTPKVFALAKRIRELNPDVEVIPLNGSLEAVVGLGLVRRMDLIFSCLDNRLARRTLNRMCRKVRKPWVDGAMENFLGDVSVFLAGDGPCYECRLSRIELEIIAQSFPCTGIALANVVQGRVPTTSTMGSIVAALQVQLGMRVYHGRGIEKLAGHRIVVNCEIDDFYTLKIEKKEDCPGHIEFGEIEPMPGWTRAGTTPRQILEHYSAVGGDRCHLRLGRDIVVSLRCVRCEEEEELGEPQLMLSQERARCPKCSFLRTAEMTNAVERTEALAERTLSQLGIPPLDVLEVKGGAGSRWYELTGDAAFFDGATVAGAH